MPEIWKRMLALLRKSPSMVETRSYNAVTVAPVTHCCAAARATLQHPILVRQLPRVPLPGCTMPEACRCELRVWSDRRIGERRIPTDAGSPSERRKRGGRRSSDRNS